MAIGRPPALFYYSAKARSRESSGERENRDNSWLGGKKDFNDAAGASLAGGFERNPLSFQGFSFSSILVATGVKNILLQRTREILSLGK